MESRKIVLMNLLQGRNKDSDVQEGLVDTAGEEEHGTNRDSSTDIYILSYVKYIAAGNLLWSTRSSV